MSVILIIILSIVVLFVLGCGLFLFVFWKGMSEFMAPSKPEECIKHIKWFLGYEFGDEYIILNFESKNQHPDRPLTVSLQLSEKSFQDVLSFLSNQNFSEEITENNNVKYVTKWIKQENMYQKEYSSFHYDNLVPFFVASLTVNLNTKIFDYYETMC